MKLSSRLVRALLSVVTLAALSAINTDAQLTTATFYGPVVDPSGAASPGATVVLTNEGTGAAGTKNTDSSGEFVFDFLQVGRYTLRIQAPSFKTLQSTGLELTAAQSIRQRYTLEIGAVSEAVTVQGSAPLVNAVSSEQVETFTTRDVRELPLARRNYSSILQVGTGVTTTSGATRLNGIGRSGGLITVDGTDANANPEGRSSSMYGAFNFIDTISIEAIQEVQTIKGVIPAEYGQTAAGGVNLISKSGTNNWHGSLFENFQAEELAARNQFLSTKPPLTFNQYGGSIGGPIRRNKIFIFGTYEGYQQSAFQQVTGNVPTQQLRNQMLAAVPSYSLVLDVMPLPNQPFGPGADVGVYLGARSSRARENHAVVKGDIRINDTSSLALTYTRGRPYQLTPRIFLNGANDREFFGWQERGTANYTTGGARWSSETRFGYNLNDMKRVDFFINNIYPGATEKAFGGERIPLLNSSLGFTSPDSEFWTLDGPTWSLEEKYALNIGSHSFKFGGKYMHEGGGRTNVQNVNVFYGSKADLLANSPSTVTPTFGRSPNDSSSFQAGFFFQDDWRVNPRLVVNLGIRYDFFSSVVPRPKTSAPAAFYNPDGLLDSQFHFGPFRDPNDPYNSDGWVNLGPRVGFSYNPDGNSKTVIRGGFSMLYSPLMPSVARVAVGSPTVPFRITFSRQDVLANGLKWPVFNDAARAIVEASSQVNVFEAMNPNVQAPYTMNYTLGVQHELASSLMIESAFVGNRGVKFPMYRIFNPPNRLTGIRPNPALSSGYYVDNSQSSVYSSWQTSIRKRYSRNLSGSFHYTWAKALSTAGGDVGAYYEGDAAIRIQDFFNPRADRGPSTGDITHYVAADWFYELPRLTGLRSGVLRQMVGGWQVSGIVRANTGEPLLITQSSAIEGSRPDYVGGSAITSNYTESLQYLNKAAFRTVPLSSLSGATIRPGNLGNGAVRGPGLWNVDFSLGKNFSLSERIRIAVRGDMFNALNHTNMNAFSTDINNGQFGKFTSTRGARVIQLNARLSW
jgi:outer membrane receptor protein involved in Fe transport